MKKNYYKIYFLIAIFLVISSCASVPIASYVSTGTIGAKNFFGLIIGCCLAWYCWVEAKRKNRNEWIWLILGILFGFIPLLILVYLKDLDNENQAKNDS